MKNRKSKSVVAGVTFALLAVMPLFGGCGEAAENSGGKEPEEYPRPDTAKPKYLPYSIRFDLKGNPVIVDEKGREVKLEPVDPPFEATSLVDVQTISVVTYTGSCVQIYSIGGKLYAIPLPDSVCKSL